MLYTLYRLYIETRRQVMCLVHKQLLQLHTTHAWHAAAPLPDDFTRHTSCYKCVENRGAGRWSIKKQNGH